MRQRITRHTATAVPPPRLRSAASARIEARRKTFALTAGNTLRLSSAIAILLATAVGCFAVARGVDAAAIALVGGMAAVLAAWTLGNRVDETSAERTFAGDPLEIEDVLQAVGQPVLVVAGGRVSHANADARALLGDHIVGQDARLAIRHPAAAERLASPGIGNSIEPVDLVGLGSLDRRWQMRIGDAPGGRRIVHLVDQTGSYAAERMRVDFVANASHELRTPLASILGYIETLGDEAGEDPAIRARFLKVMFDEAQRMQRLIDDLISLSRIEAEKYRLPDSPVDLANLIDEVAAELPESGVHSGDRVVADIAAPVPPVAGDRAQLSQMLHNLIGNAMKYGRPGTPVAVTLTRDPNGIVRLSVADQGDGIAAEHIPRLTERFYRADPSRSRAAGGTGLGLAIVKHIVERHRGRLDIASVVGTGTTVTVLLPAHGGAVIKV